jgi:curved DNA-binding protein CbpA
LANTYYHILQVGIRATPEEIKAAYKKLARQYHPDLNGGDKSAEEKFKTILEAYQTLSDPAKKDLYDVKLYYKSITAPQTDPAYRGVPKSRRDKENEAYKNRRKQREAYREYTGPPIRERITPQSIALTLLVVGSFVMVAYWFGDFMNRWTAKEHLQNGDYEGALHFDNEFGEAYYARFKARKQMGASLKVQLFDLNLAIRYTDESDYHQYLDRAKIYFGLDSLNKCLSDYESARTINPQSDTAYFALGELYAYYLNQPRKALTYYDSTLRIRPTFPEANFGRGFMLYRLQRFSSAQKQFDRCMELDRGDKRTFFYRGSSRLVLGDSLGACSDLDQALTMGMEEAKPILDRYCGRFGF